MNWFYKFYRTVALSGAISYVAQKLFFFQALGWHIEPQGTIEPIVNDITFSIMLYGAIGFIVFRPLDWILTRIMK